MGDGVAQGGQNVRAAIGLIDNTIRGAHAMAMADLVREFSQTKIVMAALPFAATVAGIAAVAAIAVEVAEKYKEWREEQEKLTAEQTRFHTAIQTSFNSLDDRLLEAQKKTDELRNNHLGALRKELELIDHASMADLVKEFDLISKASDSLFDQLKGHWYTFGIGSAGAKHALDQFKTSYDSLLIQGKDGEASDLLKGTRESAEHVLAMQKQAKDSLAAQSGKAGTDIPDQLRYAQATNELKKAGVSWTEKEIAAQEAIVEALQKQSVAQGKIAELKKALGTNATTQTGNDASARSAEAARAAVSTQLAIAEQVISGDKAVANAQLEIQRASVSARLASDLDFAQREYDVKIAANKQMAGALDKAGKDYQNQLKDLNNKALELTAAHEAEVSSLTARSTVEQNKRDLATLEAGERDKIQATGEGSAERLAVIDSAIKLAQAKALQDTDFYRTLGTERVQVARQMADEEAKVKAEAGKIAAENDLKMGELALASDRAHQELLDSAHRVTEAQRMAEAEQQADADLALKSEANAREQAALDVNGKGYENKLKELQNRELQLIREHENQKTAIKQQAEIARNNTIEAAEKSLENSLITGLTNVLLRHQSFASVLSGIGDQIASGILQNAIKSAIASDYGKEKQAAAAARKAFNIGLDIGGPAGFILGPVLAAGAFASVLAYAGGTDGVPGTGRGDVVPAVLTPGEGVVPGGVMDGLRTVAKNGGFDKSPGMTVHPTFSPTIHALDSDGVDKVLTKHGNKFQKHFENVLRKLNK